MERKNVVKVSVILPTYNRSISLVAAMNSVLSQSERDLELIVVDDCSTEDIAAVVKQCADPRVKYLRRERNGGGAAARNSGLAVASGEYIAFQDSDDLWLPGKLRRQLELLADQPSEVGVVTGGKILYGRDNKYRFGPGRVAFSPKVGKTISLEEDQLAAALVRNPISLQNALFRANCYPDRMWFDSCAKANQDWEFAVRLLQHTKLLEVSEPFVLAFISGDSISRNPRKASTGILRILRKNRQVLVNYGKQKAHILLLLASLLRRSGKLKAARNAEIASVRTYPSILLRVAARRIKWLVKGSS